MTTELKTACSAPTWPGLACSVFFLSCPQPCPLSSRLQPLPYLPADPWPWRGAPPEEARAYFSGSFSLNRKEHGVRRLEDDPPTLPAFPFLLPPSLAIHPTIEGESATPQKPIGIYDCGTGEQNFHVYCPAGPALRGATTGRRGWLVDQLAGSQGVNRQLLPSGKATADQARPDGSRFGLFSPDRRSRGISVEEMDCLKSGTCQSHISHKLGGRC